MPLVDPVAIDGVTLDRSWITPTETPRLHLLPAHRSDVCIVIRRKPSKRFHLVRWNTKTDELAHGSWFNGTLYPLRCDVSWDGRWMVYLAMGDRGETWNGLCQPPWLRTAIDCPNVGTRAGGGVFTEAGLLEANTCWHGEHSLADSRRVPRLRIRRIDSGGEDEPVLYRRLRRDGWRRRGQNYGQEYELRSMRHRYFSANVNDDGWAWRPSGKHPTLRMWYRGYLERGRTFEFELEDMPLLDATVQWATWTHTGDLLVARLGRIERFGLADLSRGQPAFTYDLEAVEPPEC